MITHEMILLQDILTHLTLTDDVSMAYGNMETGKEKNEREAKRAINRLLKKGYIRKFDYINKQNNKQKKINVYIITTAGLRYLRDIAEADDREGRIGTTRARVTIPWLEYIDPVDANRLNVFGDRTLSRQRIFQVSEASMMAQHAGATIPFNVNYYSDDHVEDLLKEPITTLDCVTVAQTTNEAPKVLKSTPKYTPLQKVMHNAAQARVNDINDELDIEDPEKVLPRAALNDFSASGSKDYIRYVHPQIVKTVAIKNTEIKSIIETHDTERGRYSGLLQSRYKTLLLYSHHEPGMSWYDRISRIERESAIKWQQALNDAFGKYSMKEGISGAILTQSVSTFTKLYKDTPKMRSSQQHFASNMDHLYVIPISFNGAMNMRDIMLHTEQENNRRITEKAIEPTFARTIGKKAKFVLNDSYHPELFPLYLEGNDVEDNDGKKFYFGIGNWMDIKLFQAIEKQLKLTDETYEFGVICEPWQAPFWEILPITTYWEGKDVTQD